MIFGQALAARFRAGTPGRPGVGGDAKQPVPVSSPRSLSEFPTRFWAGRRLTPPPRDRRHSGAIMFAATNEVGRVVEIIPFPRVQPAAGGGAPPAADGEPGKLLVLWPAVLCRTPDVDPRPAA